MNKNQLKHLRKLSHAERPLFQMGKHGLNEAFIKQIDDALTKRELIKFTLLQNSDENLQEVADEIATQLEATVVQVIGSTAILYRESSREKDRKISRELNQIK